MKCPCGSNKNFNECCEPLISGKKPATSPEELMRSRFSAFATKSLEYLKNSLDPQNRHEFNMEASRQWSDNAKFTQLEVIHTEEKGNNGIVEFKAHFEMNETPQVHHEIGKFRKNQGQWFYKSGRILETKDNATESASKNPNAK